MFTKISSMLRTTQQNLINIRLTRLPHACLFRPDTEHIRNDTWKAATTPENLQKRWVEITGPGNDAKMVINAMNSKANGYMLDLEDSMSPTSANVTLAHENIRQVVRGELKCATASKSYILEDDPVPTFMVRVRGLHMPNDATIYDICEFLEHSGLQLHAEGRGPYVYIPKLETYEEALFVNTLLSECEKHIGLPENTVKVTVLIETFPAIFQTDEIVYALRDRIAGLNCGRWDYLFSMIKSMPSVAFPDRSSLQMDLPFMEAYVRQIVHTCHRRDIHAMGGMSAFIPSKGNNDDILKKVNDDKTLEISRGCDGAWVAHPGLIDPVQRLFSDSLVGKDHQKTLIPKPVSFDELIPHNFDGPFSSQCLKNNLKVASEYTDEWLSGNGAVAIDGLMEDLATAEISLAQLRNWRQNNISGPYSTFSGRSKTNVILEEYVNGDACFLHDVAAPHLDMLDNFEPVHFEGPFVDPPKSGLELTKERGAFLKSYLSTHSSYGFLGTSNGIAAVNVVAGGRGKVGPYAGGWQANAMKNRLGMLLPDTLHVAPEECAQTAAEFNEHLYRAHLVQEEAGLNDINYSEMALLADLEQGWNTPEKTRISVRKAVEAGINVMHIEDQGDKKRCGHLGDKELNSYDDYSLILRSANLAAREMGVHHDVTFVARTDAYSAKRIHYSTKLTDKAHPEHQFIDWERGTSPDGKYLYLKTGKNPETGNLWGLDLSIYRGYRVVSDGLASHVWMETPDADLQVAKDFMDGVNERLAAEGKRAYGLYNHSPSFDWDVKFVKEAEPLAKAVADDILSHIIEYSHSMSDDSFRLNRLLTENYKPSLKEFVHKSLEKHGSEVNGDHLFENDLIEKMMPFLIDYSMGEKQWLAQYKFNISNSMMSTYKTQQKKLKEDAVDEGFVPLKYITECIVEQRLRNFGPQLASFGYNMHLITLPEFHVTSFRMHDLATRFEKTGIEAFVSTTQRPERILSENDPTYTYYKHQTATGTGVEAAFNKAVGSSDVNTLEDSTEADDLKKRSH
jgi:malate synthase